MVRILSRDGDVFWSSAIYGAVISLSRRESPRRAQPCRYLRRVRKILATWWPVPRSGLSLLQIPLHKMGMRKGEVKDKRKERV